MTTKGRKLHREFVEVLVKLTPFETHALFVIMVSYWLICWLKRLERWVWLALILAALAGLFTMSPWAWLLALTLAGLAGVAHWQRAAKELTRGVVMGFVEVIDDLAALVNRK